MNAPRSYRLGQRAISAGATRDAIIAATLDALTRRPIAELTLEKIASLAGCSVRTVIRHMGSRDRAVDLALTSVLTEAEHENPDAWRTVDDALHSIVDHYTRRGALVWSILSQENSEPRFAGLAQIGRGMHLHEARRIVQLHDERLTNDEHLVELVSVVTDITTWHLLVTAHSKTPREAGEAMRRIVQAVLTSEEAKP
ncbi:MAG: hypothetical protein Q7J04_00610 [Microcella sp.]|nr:hypothetical protein [Microcella sp.]